MKNKSRLFNCKGLFLLLFAGVLFGCSKEGEQISPNKIFAADSVNVQNVCYTNFIHDLLKKNCSTCHGDGGSAQTWWFNENTYQNAVDNYRPILNTMVNCTMPPPPKFPFSQRDRELLNAWLSRGLPEK